MANIEALLGVMELVAASKGEVDSRIRLQKEAYLLATRKVGRFRLASFTYHHFGPYSRELSDALQSAVVDELLAEHRHEADDGSYVKYSYKLTEKGSAFLGEAHSDLGPLTEYAERFSKVHWRALELAATIRYLELGGDAANREDAVAQAVSLKPLTEKYSADARRVLEQL